mmetsp:Transcript_7061/g.10122  ORF Transcript_7061/g.10122 Transcript_7061/m.10122 type:complete len:269 (-) Transcript_7061:486-1292(-)
MPPRTKDGLCFEPSENQASDANTSKLNNKNEQHNITSSAQKHRVFFRVGPLRFGSHGLFGISSTIIVAYALFKSSMRQPIPFWLAFCSVFTSTACSIGSYDLLYQVPKTSHIASWIFPPHREAFKRTIAIIGYLNIRLIHEWNWILAKKSIHFSIILFLYTNYHFFPKKASLSNGNTWVFVIPMFVGFNFDTLMQFPSNILTDPNWISVLEWNQNRVNDTFLLLTLFCALQIAFMFTLAFRGIMSIKKCYWIAAVIVGLLCVHLFLSF